MSSRPAPLFALVPRRARTALAALGTVGALGIFAACADPGTGPRASATAPALARGTTATDCSVPPVKAVRVTPAALTLTVGQTAAFTACTQFSGAYALRSSAPGVATVPAGATPVPPAPGAPKAAQVAVTAVAPGTATITVTDKKGNIAAVRVTVTAPAPQPITFDPASPLQLSDYEPNVTSFPEASVAVREAGYTGTFTLAGCTPNTPGATCGRLDDGTYLCRVVGFTGATHTLTFGLTSAGGSGTLRVQSELFAYPPSLTCTVTVADATGQTASYEVRGPRWVTDS